jgi:lipid A 3-O-deacylase
MRWFDVKHKWHFLVAMAASFAVLISAQPVHSGSTGYDMSRLIDEPHPFAADAAAQVPPKIVTLQPSDSSTYTIPVSVTGGVRQGQPYSAGRPSRSASTEPASQVTGASTIPESLPPQLDFPMVTSIPASKSVAATSIIRAPAKKLPVQMSQASLKSDDPSYLTLGAGYYDINDNQGAAEFRVEWRFKEMFWGIHPFAGVMGTSDSAVYSYGGIAFDWKLGKFVFTPSFSAGAYRDGDGKDLGHVVEFRSALEIAYEFENRHRLGLIFYHLSNASISDNNPGTEVFSLGYSIPFD